MRTQSLLDEFIMKLDATVLPGNTNYAGEIYHYTSLKSINSILLEHEDKINLWASRYDCLNDISEGKVVIERYREACEELRQKNLISDEMYEIFVHVSPSKNEIPALSYPLYSKFFKPLSNTGTALFVPM